MLARIRTEWCPSVGHDSDAIARLESGQQRRSFARFVVLVQAGCWRSDGITRQKVRCPARVFSSDQGDFAKNTKCPRGDVFEIANRRRDDEQRAGHSMSAECLLYH